VRRIQALQALGWTIADIARQSGLYEKTLRNPIYRGTSVYRATAEAVAETYERLSMTLPDGGYHERCRRMAAKRGYAPPLAWDDIDNDDAPKGIARRSHGRPEVITARVEDFDFLIRNGETEEQAAERLGVRLSSFKDQRRRLERGQVA